MKKALILFFIAFSLNAYSQINGKKILNFPKNFADPDKPLTKSLDEYPTSHDNNTFDQNWVVYSDRANNATNRQPGSGSTFKQADFLEKFYVVEERGIYVHIVKDDTNPIEVNLSPSAEDYGWIAKDKLILYKGCIKNDRKINQKGMLVNSEETIKRAKVGDESTLVKFFKDPNLTQSTSASSKLYQIYHIYKKVGNSVLLGKAYESRGKIEDNIVGWVQYSRITTWKHRIAIEPNWEENAWRERKDKNESSSIFMDKNDCYNYINGGNNNKAVWSSDPVKNMQGGSLYQRAIGEWRRFPVLEYKDEKCLQIGVVGDIHTQTNVYSSNQGAAVDQKISDYSSQMGKKNFMFVLDGTTSMQPYFNAVSNAVRISIEELIRKYGSDSNPPKFGCVVYRDHAEKNRLIESFDLSPNVNEVLRFIDNVRALDYQDTDAAEAVNYGLSYALRLLPQNESNFVVHVGDAANHNRNDASFISNEQVSRMIEMKQCHLLSFQVANKGNYDYERFALDMKNILESAANNIRRKNTLKSPGNTIQFRESANTKDYVFNKLSNSPISGNIVECKIGKAVTPNILQDEIIYLVESSGGLIDNLKGDVYDIQSGTSYSLILNKNISSSEYSRYVDNYNEILLNVLNNMGLTREQTEYISQDRFQFYSPAYAPLKKNGLDNKLFKPVILMSRLELHKLHMMFDMLGNIITLPMNERRQRFYDTWVELLSSHLGEADTERLRQLSTEELSDIIYGTGGLNITSSMLKMSINCIMDPSCMDDRNFNTFLSILKGKSMSLEKILNNSDDPRQFRSSGIIYYWLDFDVLP